MKTNRLDSRKLSTALRGGELKSIHVPAPKYRELRHLVQLRDTHVQRLAATKCRIKALLLYEGIPFPSDEGKEKQWSARVVNELLEGPACADEPATAILLDVHNAGEARTRTFGTGSAKLGDKDEAFIELEKAFAEHDWELHRLRADPLMSPLRDDPRFKEILKRLNLPR